MLKLKISREKTHRKCARCQTYICSEHHKRDLKTLSHPFPSFKRMKNRTFLRAVLTDAKTKYCNFKDVKRAISNKFQINQQLIFIRFTSVCVVFSPFLRNVFLFMVDFVTDVKTSQKLDKKWIGIHRVTVVYKTPCFL